MGKRRRKKQKAGTSSNADAAPAKVVPSKQTEEKQISEAASEATSAPIAKAPPSQQPAKPPSSQSSRERNQAGDGRGGKRQRIVKDAPKKEEAPKKDEMGDWLDKVRKQLEFYFGDANLRRDKFMRRTVDAGGGFVELSTLLGFNRLKAMQCCEISQLVAAIGKSQMLELSSDKSKVRRDLAKAPMDSSDPVARSIYVEGFPLTFCVDDLAKLFAKNGQVKFVDIPRHRETGEPRGFCFVEFASTEEAVAAVAAVNGVWPSTWQLRSDGKVLRAMSKQEWLKYTNEYKALQCAARGSSAAATSEVTAPAQAAQSTEPALSSSAGSHDEAASIATEKASTADVSDAPAKEAEVAGAPVATDGKASAASGARCRPGCLVVVSGFPQPQTLLSIRQFAEHVVPVEYCDFPDPYATCAHLRLRCQEDCQALLEDLKQTRRMLGWLRPEVKILEPEEEEKYWKEVDSRREARKAQGKQRQPRRPKRTLVRPLRTMLQNPQGVIRRGPVTTTAIKRWSSGVPVTGSAAEVFKGALVDTVGGNAYFVQPGFGKRQRGRRRVAKAAPKVVPPRADLGKRAAAAATAGDEPSSKAARRQGAAPSVPPPSPFVMPNTNAKPKRKAEKPVGTTGSSSFIPPPSPYARPASASASSAAKPPSPRRPAVPPPSPVARPPTQTRGPPQGKEESKDDEVGDGPSEEKAVEGAAKKPADSLLDDVDDILGLMD